MGDFQAFLRKKGYEISQHASSPEVQKISGVVVDASGWSTYLITKNNFIVSLDEIYIRLISKCPVRASTEDLLTINLMLMKINFGIVVGCFEMDFADGEIQLRSSLPVKTAAGSSIVAPAKLLEPMFGRHISVLAKYSASIVRAVVNPPSESKPAPAPKVEEDDEAKTAAMLYKMLKQLLLAGQTPSSMNVTQPAPHLEKKEEKQEQKREDKKEPEPEPEKKEEKKENRNVNVKVFPPEILQYQIKDGKKVKKGKGAFSTVYEGRLYGSKVAIKVIKEELPMDVVDLLESEVAVMNSLQHPNIVLMLGMCKSPPSLVMPLMEKGSLQNFISKAIPIPFKLKVKYLLDSARGMAYVHGNKILHGDLKPLNILIDQNDVAHVADFGLSRIKATTASLRAGTIIQGFTPVFSAPELLSNGNMSIGTDVYAFGIMMWALATYKTPFVSQFTNVNDLRNLLAKGVRPDVAAYPNDVTPDYKLLASECWQADSSRRPNFLVILDRLEQML